MQIDQTILTIQTYIERFYQNWINPELIFSEISYVCVLFAIVYLFNKYSPAFSFLVKNTLRRRDWLWLYGLFTLLSILGNLLAIKVHIGHEASAWAMINIRSIGAILAGLLGGPILGVCVGFSAGFVRYLAGGITAEICFLTTTLAGLIAGLVYLLLLKFRPEERFSWKVALLTTLFVESINKALVFLVTNDLLLIQAISLPMLLANSLGVMLCVGILHDYERLDTALSGNALSIAKRLASVLKQNTSLTQTATELALIVKSETGAAAVAFTDRSKVIAFVGAGNEHHCAGDLVTNELIKEALDSHNTIFIDGHSEVFHCKKSTQCPLHSAHITLITIEDKIEGALVLFESKNRFFPRVDRDLAENLASLLAEQILAARYPEKLATLQDKYLLARVNPHFFGNALATISAITRKDTKKARMLMGVLAELMRERVSPTNHFITLKHEIEFLKKYLQIEQERFGDRLYTTINFDKNLEPAQIPQFILQLIVENAIKHGVSQLLPPSIGEVNIRVRQISDQLMAIEIKDNVGAYNDNETNKALASAGIKSAGMKMVDELIKSQFNSESYGIDVDCKENEYTLVTILLPIVKWLH
jgi:two-component system LytT family sensor kinase